MLKLLSAVLVAGVLPAQQPSISNANLQTASVGAGLERAVQAAMAKQPGPAWIGYAVPKIPGDHQACCWNDNSRGCGLEGQRAANFAAPAGPVKLEGPTHVAILFRLEQGNVGKIRSFSIDCSLDAGGLPFHWLSDVKPSESVALLLKYATRGASTDNQKSEDAAVQAIAMHAAPESLAALQNLATSSPSEKLRRSAIFWLANSRGHQGYLVVGKVLREDASDKVREHAIFCMTQSSDPEAIPSIIKAAKEDKSAHVRGQALFWLAQKASKQASAAINDTLANDPDTEVKKKAVFALTQMQSGEGVPMLIQVARNNPNPAVRKQAMFWLGQSKDPRALRFFEDVLAK